MKDLKIDFSTSTFTTDIFMPKTERLAKYLSHLLVIYCDELDFCVDPGGFISVDSYLVNFATILFFINFVKDYCTIWT